MKITVTAVLIAALMLSFIGGCSKKTEEAPVVTEETVEIFWSGNLEEAVEKAQRENKTVLVNFTGSDWCGWCIKLKAEVFSKDEFAEYANRSLVLVELDFPQKIEQSKETKDYNRKTLEKYGVRGFPTIVLISGSGSEIARTGYQQGGPVAYVEHLKGFIGN